MSEEQECPPEVKKKSFPELGHESLQDFIQVGYFT